MKKVKEYQTQILLIAFFIMVAFFLFRSSLARYVYNGIKNYQLESQGFYFNSSVLSMNGGNYKVDNWDGVNSYTLTIDVNNKKNEQVYTKSDIEYITEVTCSSKVTCSTSKQTGIIRKDQKTDSYLITITPKTNFLPGETVEVMTKASSTKPYEKEIKATYTIEVSTVNFSYSIEDSVGSNFLKLKLTNSIPYYQVMNPFGSYQVGDHVSLEEYKKLSDSDKQKCFSAEVKLTFTDQNIFLDMTNKTYLDRIPGSELFTSVNGYNYVKEYKFYVGANSNTEVLFYKKKIDQDYTYPFPNVTPIIKVSVVTAS